MIVCVCNRISDREIERHVQSGMDFSDLQLELGVATQCGQCEGCARELVAQCGKAPGVALPAPVAVQRPVWSSSTASA